MRLPQKREECDYLYGFLLKVPVKSNTEIVDFIYILITLLGGVVLCTRNYGFIYKYFTFIL